MKSSEISLRPCENCKKSFQPKNLQHKLCSNKCRRAYQQMRYDKGIFTKTTTKTELSILQPAVLNEATQSKTLFSKVQGRV